MSNMIVLAFDSPDGAMEMRDKLLVLQKQELIKLADAAIVVRDAKGKAKVKQLQSLVGAGALGGAFWGMLIGLIFFMPWLGLAAGALGGALGGKFTDVGIDDKFIKEVGETIEPGHSALFLLVVESTQDKVAAALEGTKATVVQTNLSDEEDARLREFFGAEEIVDEHPEA